MTEPKKVFVDSSPLIYFLDAHEVYAQKVKQIFSFLRHEKKELVVSVLTCMEYLTLPIRQNNEQKRQALLDFLDICHIPVYDINFKIAKKAAEIRAFYPSFKPIDSLQLACACINDCDVFLTNDKQLCQFKEVHCVMINDWPFF